MKNLLPYLAAAGVFYFLFKSEINVIGQATGVLPAIKPGEGRGNTGTSINPDPIRPGEGRGEKDPPTRYMNDCICKP